MTMVKPGMFVSERYEIIALIGSGGTADVYKAKDHRLNRNVAIKILKQSFTGDSKIVAKFRQEAQSCAGLTHPNIVSVYDVGNDGNLYYIVMELIEGITLKRFIEKKGKLEIKEAIGIAIQIAQGLDAAHANHIVHRDIKPQNIIISREGKVKVTDFGIARATLGTSNNTINQAPVGSVHYLSPEQARGGFSDEKSDIYSLGVSIYEMLAGKVPFSGDNNVSVALLQIQGEATPLHEINPDVTPSIEKIVAKCMQKKPDRRYFSASELIADLKSAVNNPSGDFVKLGKKNIDASPTINMTREEAMAIRKKAHSDKVRRDDNYDDGYGNDGYDDYPQDMDEEDELDKVSTRTEKAIIIGSVILVIVFLGFIFMLLSKFNLLGGGGANNGPSVTSSVEKLSDNDLKKYIAYEFTLDKMTETLKERGINDFTTKGVYNDTVETDKVVNMYYNDDQLCIEYSLGAKPADTIIMPDLVAQKVTYSQAREQLLSLSPDFRITAVESKEHTDDEVNLVIGQDIASGTAIPLNQEIKLTYSIGPENVNVPDLTTNPYTRDMVENQYKDIFNLKFEYDQDHNYPTEQAGVVVRTVPEKGNMIKKGSEVTVYLSSTVVKLPDLTKKSKADAVKALTDIGLKANAESEDFSKDVAAGCVMSQSVSPNSTADRGSTITLVISKGPAPTETPTPTPTQMPIPTEEATDPNGGANDL